MLILGSLPLRAQDDPKAPKLEGFWLGTLKDGKAELRLAFSVTNQDGKLAATFDSIDQGARGLAVDEVSLQDGKARFALKKYDIVFEGKINKEGTEIVGDWKQGGSSVAVTFKRVDKLPGMKRPQEPKGPFPYVEEEVV